VLKNSGCAVRTVLWEWALFEMDKKGTHVSY